MNTQSNQSNNPIHINPLDGAIELYRAGITFHHSFIIRNPDRTIYGYGYILSNHPSYEIADNLPWINLEFSPKTIYQITLKTKAQMKRELNK